MAKIIQEYSSVPVLDLTRYFELLIFCWLTGNNDMHLKNFSLYQPKDNEIRLTPAYDLVNAVIVNPQDNEELALTLNARKRKIKTADIVQAMRKADISDKVIANMFRKFHRVSTSWLPIIRQSFLPEVCQEAYWQLICERFSRLSENPI